MRADQTGEDDMLTNVQVNGKSVITPKPETEECNIHNFIYSRTRPFHPRRLFKLLYDKFIMQLEIPDDDEDDSDNGSEGEADEDEEISEGGDKKEDDSEPGVAVEGDSEPLDMRPNDVILANKRACPLFGRLFRSKGEFLLATRPHRAGEWSQAGAMITMRGGRPWFCTLPPEHYLTGDEEVDKLVQFDISNGGEWGDRRQELIFIGRASTARPLRLRWITASSLTTNIASGWRSCVTRDSIMEQGKRRCRICSRTAFPIGMRNIDMITGRIVTMTVMYTAISTKKPTSLDLLPISYGRCI
jgi:G3E family GTPase